MPTLPLTRSQHLLPFAAVLRRQGEPVERQLRLAGLPSDCLHDPQRLIPVAAVSQFRELVARRTALPNLALAATANLDLADLGGFGQSLLRAPTLRRALSELRRMAETQSSNLVIELQRQPGGHLFCCHRALSEIGVGEWHRALYSLILMLKVVRQSDPAWSPSEIWIDAKGSPARFEAIESLGSTARFEHDCTGFLVPASMLALPVISSPTVPDERAAKDEQLESSSPAKTYPEALKQMLRSYASDGWLTIEDASAAAHTSVRTMQRRLAAEQTTYSRVVDETRAEVASELLMRTGATMTEIAHELGYKNQGDFTRAFRRWAGVSPSEFRRQRRN